MQGGRLVTARMAGNIRRKGESERRGKMNLVR